MHSAFFCICTQTNLSLFMSLKLQHQLFLSLCYLYDTYDIPLLWDLQYGHPLLHGLLLSVSQRNCTPREACVGGWSAVSWCFIPELRHPQVSSHDPSLCKCHTSQTIVSEGLSDDRVSSTEMLLFNCRCYENFTVKNSKRQTTEELMCAQGSQQWLAHSESILSLWSPRV